MATATIGALRVVLGLDSAQFTSGISDTQRRLAQFSAATTRALAGVGIAGAAMAARLATASLQSVDAASKLAQQLVTEGLAIAVDGGQVDWCN
jgi:hypothetical protein